MIALEKPPNLWDNPMMKVVADKKRRSSSSELKQVPQVKPVRTREGFLMLPVKPSRQSIRAALRADRDARIA
jgi:hypothetical protein